MGNDISRDLPRRRGSHMAVRPTKVPEKDSEVIVEGIIKGCGEGWDIQSSPFGSLHFPGLFILSRITI